MKKSFFRILLLSLLLALLAGAANAEWRKENKWVYRSGDWVKDWVWTYYGSDGKEVESFEGFSSVTIPDEVDSLDRISLKKLGRDFVIKCNKGSYAEAFARRYGYQFDNGEESVVGYQIDNLEDKADWIIDNYITNNYAGRKLTDREAATVLHDWITTNGSYDYYSRDKEHPRPNQSESCILLNGTGVCNSYAEAYSYLLSKVDIRNRYISGHAGQIEDGDTSSNHAWDLVLLDGQWYHVDATWDDAGGTYTEEVLEVANGREHDKYLFVSDAEIKDLDSGRIWDDEISADLNRVGFVSGRGGIYYYGNDSETAKASVGWQTVGETFTYDPSNPGYVYRPEGRYYFSTVDGKMVIGWANIDSSRYFFNESGTMQSGWLNDDSDRYHLAEDGKMDTGWTDLTEGYRAYNSETEAWEDRTGTFTYYFGTDGKMHVGWVSRGNGLYHLADNGRLEKSTWITDEGKKYHASESGAADIGWTDLTEDYLQYNYETQNWDRKTGIFTYFFDKTGVMQTGWVKNSGKLYHMSTTNGRLEKDRWLEDDGNKYHLSASGAADIGWTDLPEQYRQYNWTTGEWETKTKMVTYYFETDGALFDPVPGDITDDGKIDGRDSVRLMKWLAGEEEDDSGESVTIRIPNGDLNHDKEVDELDLLRLMQYFGGETENLE